MSGVRDDRQRRPIAGVLLAAGGSSRMGSAKQLIAYAGRSLVRRAAEVALASDCDMWFAVVGAGSAAVRAELAGLPFECVTAADWADGISRSIRAGIRAVATSDRGFAAALLVLADQPHVTPAHLDALIGAYLHGDASAVATGYADTVGAPALFDQSRFAELRALEGDRGASALLRDDPGVLRVVFEPAALDIDAPEDLE